MTSSGGRGPYRHDVSIESDVTAPVWGGYSAAVLADNPLAYWAMQEPAGATSIADRTAAARNLTTLSSVTTGLTNGPTAAPDNKAISIPGGSAQRPVFYTGNADICIEFFYRPLTLSVNAYLCSNGFGYGVVQNTGDTIKVELNGVLYTLPTLGTCPINVWTHVAITHVGGLWTFYLNGAFDRAPNFADPVTTPTGSFLVGGGAQADFAHFAFYSTAPSAGRIAAHYAARNT